MFKIGDNVIFLLDGARGVIMEVKENLCHVIWEDYFCSWEAIENLKEDHFLKESNVLRKIK